MLEHLAVMLAGTLMLGMVTWHAARLLADGALFGSLRTRLRHLGKTYTRIGESSLVICEETVLGRLGRFFELLLACRLCLNTQAAFVFTWGTLVTGLVVERSLLPAAEWGFAFAVGPFLTAAWSEVIRRVERIEVP